MIRYSPHCIRTNVRVHPNRCTALLCSLFIMLLIPAAFPVSAAELIGGISYDNSGTYIEVSGSGFWPGEQVDIRQEFYDGNRRIGPVYLTTITTDQDGRFKLQIVPVLMPQEASSIVVSATGQSSGVFVSTTIYRAATVLELSLPFADPICEDTITSANSFTMCAALYQQCYDELTPLAPLPGREVQFFINEGDCGAAFDDGDPLVGVTNDSGIACVTVDRLDTLLSVGEVSFRARFAGEPKPDENDPPNSACPDDVTKTGDGRVHLSASNDCQKFNVITGCQDPGVDFEVTTGDSADLYYVRAADLDRDNYTDVVFTGSSTTGLFIAFGSAGDSLEEPVQYLTINLAAFDLSFVNEDTLLDIVAIKETTVYLLLNEGNRQFLIDSFSIAPPEGRTAPTPAVSIGYFNEDSYTDLLSAPGLLFFGDGAGGFVEAVDFAISFEAAVVADFNNDLFDDFLALTPDAAELYLNTGLSTFSMSAAIPVDSHLLEIPPTLVAADLNRDGATDFAFVLPLATAPDQSVLTVGLGDGIGGVGSTAAIAIGGAAYSVTAEDVNRDNILDLIVANATTQVLEVYLGDGTGQFSGPNNISIGDVADQIFALASLDIDRDGNSDFVSGDLGGGNLIVAVNQLQDFPVLYDQMATFVLDGYEHSVEDPAGYVISSDFRTVAGAEFQQFDFGGDSLLDERTLNYNLQYGEYQITYLFETSDAGRITSTLTASINIDGSQQATFFSDYSTGVKAGTPESLVFYYTVEEVSSIQPPNGIPVNQARPTIDWSGLVTELPPSTIYHFQLDRYYDFREPIFEDSALTEPMFEPPLPLGNDSVFYWRFRYFDGNSWSEFSRTFALYITGVCCVQSVGNIDQDPQGSIDATDLTTLVAYLFGGQPLPDPDCDEIGDVLSDPWDKINVADLYFLVEYLFGDGPMPPYCP